MRPMKPIRSLRYCQTSDVRAQVTFIRHSKYPLINEHIVVFQEQTLHKYSESPTNCFIRIVSIQGRYCGARHEYYQS